MATCDVCFRRCALAEGQRGSCGARVNEGGRVKALFYGQLSSLALDPIEKKPLLHFYPGSSILSVGSLGCNLHCPFCQNHHISQAAEGGGFGVPTAAWFRTVWRDRLREALLDELPEHWTMFDRAALERLIDEHQNGGKDRSYLLFSLLMLSFQGKNA